MQQHVTPVPDDRAVPDQATDDDAAVWRFVGVYVVRERAAARLEEAVAGIARGLEILEVVRLSAEQRRPRRGAGTGVPPATRSTVARPAR